MKNIRFIFSISVILFALGLASCNNFLKATEVKKEIEDSIAYANAKSCKVYLKSDASVGSFLSGNEVDC